MRLYHGTNTHFEEFSNKYLATEDSNDQYGSGFYFYSVKSKTVLHGDLRVYADVEVLNPVEHDAKIYLTWDNAYDMIIKAPNLDERLNDHGDVEFEGYNTVLFNAVKLYEGMQFLDGLNAIGNDFYDGSDCYIQLREFKRATGIDCITDLSRDIYVVLDKNQITIQKVVHEQEDNDE